MGASTSVSLRPEEIDDLRQGSCFSAKQIQRLWTRFRKLDRSASGAISSGDFFKIPELAMNPLAHRISAALEMGNNSGEVNFRGFVHAMNVFHKNAPRETKLKFVFSVYDVDHDGFISVEDLTSVLSALVGTNLGEDEIARLARNTVKEYDSDGDDMLSIDEFRACVNASTISEDDDGMGDLLCRQMTIKF